MIYLYCFNVKFSLWIYSQTHRYMQSCIWCTFGVSARTRTSAYSYAPIPHLSRMNDRGRYIFIKIKWKLAKYSKVRKTSRSRALTTNSVCLDSSKRVRTHSHINTRTSSLDCITFRGWIGLD